MAKVFTVYWSERTDFKMDVKAKTRGKAEEKFMRMYQKDHEKYIKNEAWDYDGEFIGVFDVEESEHGEV